jgi:hypothetical protein
VLVDVDASGAASAADSGFNNGSSFYLSDLADDIVARGTTNGGSFSVDEPVTLMTGEVYSVSLSASACNGAQGSGSSASVDPFLAVDPSVADGGGYSII